MVLFGKLSVSYSNYIDIMREYILSSHFDLSKHKRIDVSRATSMNTIHEYEEFLHDDLRICIDVIKPYIGVKLMECLNNKLHGRECYPMRIQPITGMNELYISSPEWNASNNTFDSDNVFEMPHIDGPFFWLPYAKIYRCLVGIQGHSNVSTVFPTENREIVIDTNSFLAFDYNNEIHYVVQHSDTNTDNASSRIMLKLHYIVYSPFLPGVVVWIYKMMNQKYNYMFRKLFLMTQKHRYRPQTIFESVMSVFVNRGTRVYYCFHKLMTGR
jgi:hypothetical protein